jgi:hypothetical protein
VTTGIKHDQAKNRWDLLDFDFMDQCVRVLTMGSIKYAPNNWKLVERRRYVGALLRHISAYLQGEALDPETGCSHLAHAFCNLMFLFGHDKLLREKLPVSGTA